MNNDNEFEGIDFTIPAVIMTLAFFLSLSIITNVALFFVILL